MEVEVGISPQNRKRKLRHKTDRNVQLPDCTIHGRELLQRRLHHVRPSNKSRVM